MEGERLGEYAIEAELGSGGMGRVVRATGPDGVVALKVVHPHLLETPGFFKRFMREAQLGQSIRHENVVRTIDCDQEFTDGKPHCFLVMEYVEGQTLSELLRELERVPEELCRHVAREICKGLSAIHDAGVVHRDLKPENVLITPDHVVKVMDLGVAKLSNEAMKLSRSGAFVGSVEYAAPEQFKGGDVDGRTDLHALGVLLYELSSGAHPYRGGSFHEVLSRVCDDEPRRLGDVNPQLSAFFEEVVHTLLVKDPRGRFTSATQLRDVLDGGEHSDWWHERARSLQAETKRPIRRIRIPRETAVYGRDDELQTLRSLYDLAKSGDGHVVLIEGEAGIGKSRLVDELVSRLHAAGEDFNFLFGSYPPGGAATAAGGFSSAFREHFGESGSAAHLPDNQVLVPAFDALLRGEGAPPDAQALTTGSLQTCFARATRTLAEERTTIVLIDDLHFAPDDGRALFSSLAMAVPGARVLLIGSTRPGVSEEWRAGLTRLAQTTSIPVERLGPKDLVALLADSLGSEHLAEDLSGKLAVKSDGNPFFAFEIIRGLREGQFITQQADGTWASTMIIDEIEIPSTVLDLVSARVADLSEDERDLLDVACCWGFEFDPGLIGDVLGVGRIPLLKRFAQIERKHRLVRGAGRRMVFDHHQVQEALYGTLLEPLREEYHAALAEALEARTNADEASPASLDGAVCVELCEHFLKGARGDRALRYLESAHTHLTKGYLHAQVVALTERALGEAGLLSGLERARALLSLSDPLDYLGRRDRQSECAQEAERLAAEAGDDELRGQAAAALGTAFWRMSRHADAESALRRAFEIARARGDRRKEADVCGYLGLVFWSLSRHPEAFEYLERHRTLCRELRDQRGEARACGNLGIVFESLGRHSEAREHQERYLALSRECGFRLGESIATGNLGNVLFALGLHAEAREHYERHLAMSRELGDRGGEAIATGNLANVFSVRGQVVEARAFLERQLVLTREIGSRRGEAIGLTNLGALWHGLGDRGRARTALEASVTICREIGERFPESYGLLGLARLADEEGDAALALQRAEEALALRREIGHAGGISETLVEIGDLRARYGDEIAAREALLEGIELSLEQGQHGQVALAHALLALLPGGTPDALLAALEAVEESSDSSHLRWLVFRVNGDRAHLEDAKRLLDASLALIPVEYHGAMLTNLRVHREIMEAWREEFGEDGSGLDASVGDDSGDDEPRGTESKTRVG